MSSRGIVSGGSSKRTRADPPVAFRLSEDDAMSYFMNLCALPGKSCQVTRYQWIRLVGSFFRGAPIRRSITVPPLELLLQLSILPRRVPQVRL